MNVVTGPALPIGASVAAAGTVSPGNGFANIAQGATVVSLTALGTLLPFSAVSIGVNGCSTLDPTNSWTVPEVLGVALGSYSAGASATVATAGVIVNTQAGASGWNFVIGELVYVGANGTLTQNAPSTGTLLPIGIAVSNTAVMLYSPVELLKRVGLSTVTASASALTVQPATTPKLQVVLSLASTQLTLGPGAYDGQLFRLLVQQGAGNNAYTILGGHVGSVPGSTAANAVDAYLFTWLAAQNTWVPMLISTGI